MRPPLVKYCIELYEKLKTQGNGFANIWDEVDKYFRSSRKNRSFNELEPYAGKSSDPRIFQSEGAHCWDILTSGLYSYMLPEKSWFFQVQYDGDSAGGINFKKQESENTRILHREIEKTNFREEAHKAIREVGLYGTLAMLMVEGKKEKDPKFSFKTYPIRTILFTRDYFTNELSTVIRKFTLTPEQAKNEFGEENLAPKVQKQIGRVRESQTTTNYIHFVGKSKDLKSYTDSNINTSLEFVSIYIDLDNKYIVESSQGFNEMPYIIAPFMQQDDEAFGRSYATEHLPEIKMLNAMMRTLIFGSEMAAKPPLLVPPNSNFEAMKISPGAMLPKDPGGDEPKFLEIRNNVALNLDLVSYQRNLIRDIFKVSLFKRLTDKKYLTAYQASEIAGEGLDLLAPIVNNLQQMFLRPIIRRAHRMLQDKEVIEVPVDSFKIEYLGKLAFAVKSLENQSAMQILQAAAMTAQFDPDSISVLNGENILRDFSYNTGAPTSWIKTEKEYQNIIAKKREQEAAAQMPQQAKDIGSAVAGLGKNVEPNSVLGALM